MENKHGENVIYRAIIKMPGFSGYLFTTHEITYHALLQGTHSVYSFHATATDRLGLCLLAYA